MGINNLNEEAQKLAGNSIIRYGVLLVGLVIFAFSQGILTWKQTSARDARGVVEAVEFDIGKLKKEISDSDDKDDKKELEKEIKEIRENKLESAQMEAASEAVDANNGVWFWSMVRHFGMFVFSIGLVMIAATGVAHEKIGALVALGLIIARM